MSTTANESEFKLCLNQSYESIRQSVILAVVPKIIHGLMDANGRSFVVEFNRDVTQFGDWANVAFKAQAPMVFSEPDAEQIDKEKT